jgi:microcystin-dependent protein
VSSPYIGEIRIFAGNFPPRNWALCNGQILPIAQNTALFSLLGTTYGGNGTTTFALPNLQSRVPLHPGQGPGLSLYDLGEQGGVESVSLTQSQMPSHSHQVNCHTVTVQADHATKSDPAGNYPATHSAGSGIYETTSTSGAAMSPLVTTPTGNGLPHENHQPYLTLNFIICLQGIFPPRS